MGVCLSWFAVRGKSPEAVQNELGLRPTGTIGSYPEHRISGTSFPGGWYVVCRWRHQFKDAAMAQLSHGAEVIACFVEEHVTVSRAAAWKDRAKQWEIVHDSEQGLQHLSTEGNLPAEFAAIRNELIAQQTDDSCDYIFDIPVEVVGTQTGFRYDEVSDVPFEVLDAGSLLQRLFGR